ncbi:hypothetical protein [Bordetella petrii]|uniref:Tail fiber assembly protein n=1 Tax=Bordetella petrii (strain ATCC BAA-461 / DSM 12804 / CCUG 43448 / CIP 107267 / Se-1111R) TaxID=340100 RepID=A9ID91_BORPD|nr:hypothetical protein [Bordetella petrii]CAP44781.1 putative tail fiber assembly protein [Bordetella petrii]
MNTITVYQTDADGLFVHQAVAHEFSLQPGTYNVPFGALLAPPPALSEGEAALAVGESWLVVQDHRAERFYRTDSGQPYEFGVTMEVAGMAVRYPGWGEVPNWLTNEAPPAPGSTWVDGAWVAPEPDPESPAGA